MSASTRLDVGVIHTESALLGVPAVSRPDAGAGAITTPRRAPGEAGLAEIAIDVARSDHWLARLGSRPGVDVRLLACRPYGRRGLLQLIEIGGTRAGLEEARATIRRLRGVRWTATSTRDRRFGLWVVSPRPRVCSWVFDHGVVCENCRFLPELGSARPEGAWHLVRPPTSRGKKAIEGLRAERTGGVGRLASVRRWAPHRAVTGRQARALELAVRLGYFEVPRRAPLRRLAEALGVSRSAAAQLLRRGQSRYLSEAFGHEYSRP